MPTGITGVSFPGPYEGIFYFQDTLVRSYYWNGLTTTRIADSIGTGTSSPGISYWNNYIYQCGGDGASVGTNDNGLYRYDVKANSWTSLTGPPISKAYNGPMPAIQGKFYQFGGYTNAYAISGTAYAYDIATNSWATLTSMPVALRTFGCTTDGIDNIYIIGGQNGANVAVNTIYEYKISTDTWKTTLTVKPNAYAYSASLYYNGNIYVFGGADINNTGANQTTCHRYNIAQDSWTAIASLPAISSYGACGVLNNKGYLLGGAGVSSNPKNTIYEYDFTNNLWRIIASTLPSTSYFFGCVAPILR